MKFTAIITLDNDAFTDPQELSRLLRKIAAKVEGIDNSGLTTADGPVIDIFGNTVGRWEVQ